MVYTLSDGTQMTRRKKIVLTGAGSGAQSDYQLKLTALWEAAIQADYDDIRFTQSDMQTLIDTWLESKVNSTTADIWAEFLTTPVDGVVKTEAYMYFGNAGVASDWDIGATFIFGDDFEDGTTNKWSDESGSTFVVDSGIKKYGSYSGHHDATTIWAESYATFSSLNGDYVVDVWLYKGENNLRSDFMIEKVGGDFTNSIDLIFNVDGTISYFDGSNHTLRSYSASTWYHCVFTLHSGADYTFDLDIDDVNEVTGGGTRGTFNAFVGIGVMAGASNSDLYVDNVFIRKYVANPPTAAFGTEEHQRRTPMMM